MAAAANHTVKAFDEDLEELRALVAVLGGWDEAAVEAAVHALTQFDEGALPRADDLAGQIGALAQEVEQRAIRLLALRAPMADDLRGIVVALKIAQLIQRLGCLALEMTCRLDRAPVRVPTRARPAVARLGAVSVAALKSSLDAGALFDDSHAMGLADAEIDRGAAIGLPLAAQSLAQLAAPSSEVARLVHFAATGFRLDQLAAGRALAHG
jgi:phosphate transport system protein